MTGEETYREWSLVRDTTIEGLAAVLDFVGDRSSASWNSVFSEDGPIRIEMTIAIPERLLPAAEDMAQRRGFTEKESRGQRLLISPTSQPR